MELQNKRQEAAGTFIRRLEVVKGNSKPVRRSGGILVPFSVEALDGMIKNLRGAIRRMA